MSCGWKFSGHNFNYYLGICLEELRKTTKLLSLRFEPISSQIWRRSSLYSTMMFGFIRLSYRYYSIMLALIGSGGSGEMYAKEWTNLTSTWYIGGWIKRYDFRLLPYLQFSYKNIFMLKIMKMVMAPNFELYGSINLLCQKLWSKRDY